MSSVRLTASLYLLVVFGCVHRSPEDEILPAFAAISADELFDRGSQPLYIAFADKRAESLFGHVTGDGRYRNAPKGAALLCPDARGDGVHGYMMVGASLDTVMGDSAYATTMQDCVAVSRICPGAETTCWTTRSGVLRTTTTYLLSRKNGKWRVARPVSGGMVNI